MKLGIIGAMDVEVTSLCEAMTVERRIERSHMVFVEGELAGCPAVVVRCGIGKVNAGVCVQILVDEFGVDHVINTGAAGALVPEIEVGDIVVSTDCVHHDVDAAILGYAPGEVPQLGVASFVADVHLRELAKEAAQAVVPDVSLFEGRIASGDQFIADYQKKQEIASKFDAICCEMEGASIAQTCWLNSVPFVVVRAISDKADGSKQVLYPIFEKRAAERSALLVGELAGRLA